MILKRFSQDCGVKSIPLLPALRELDVSGGTAEDRALAGLSEQPRLEALRLQRWQLGHALPATLRRLHVIGDGRSASGRTSVTEPTRFELECVTAGSWIATCAWVANSRLVVLSRLAAQVNNDVIALAADMAVLVLSLRGAAPQLTHLALERHQYPGARLPDQLASGIEGLPALRSLHFQSCWLAGVPQLGHCLSRLTSFSLTDCALPHFPPRLAQAISCRHINLYGVKYLTKRGNEWTDAGAAKVLQKLEAASKRHKVGEFVRCIRFGSTRSPSEEAVFSCVQSYGGGICAVEDDSCFLPPEARIMSPVDFSDGP